MRVPTPAEFEQVCTKLRNTAERKVIEKWAARFQANAETVHALYPWVDWPTFLAGVHIGLNLAELMRETDDLQALLDQVAYKASTALDPASSRREMVKALESIYELSSPADDFDAPPDVSALQP
jgi:hypothetical protein